MNLHKVGEWLGIARPSRVFASIGKTVKFGFSGGILKAMNQKVEKDLFGNPFITYLSYNFYQDTEADHIYKTFMEELNWWR